MSIAYVTFMDLVNGYGGAEGMDRDMISRAPEPVTVLDHVPSEPYDTMIVTGSWRLPNVAALEGKDFLYWPHDAQERDPSVFGWARQVVWTTPAHQEWGKQFPTESDALNPSWFDTSLFAPKDKTHDLLWAHRDVWHKGREAARNWAKSTGAELTEITGVPREEVAKAMATHKRFILLSDEIFDIAPRAVMEAQLSGCELVVNDLVGYWHEPPDVLRDRIDRAADEFWALCR